jgi:predicted MFS family arabinose efflux permease
LRYNLSARVYPQRSGFAMGVTTASYALGATIGAQILGALVADHDALVTLRLHGYSFLLLAPVLAVLIAKSNARYTDKAQSSDSGGTQASDDATASPASNHIDQAFINRYRISYGLSVFAGLMAMAHAVPFISSFQATAAAPNALNIALLGAVVLGVGNAAGGVIAGLASDKLNPVAIVTALPAIAAVALAAAAMASTLLVSLSALTVIGFTYGALIAVYPVAIARRFGATASASAYGQVFIAWGAAGLLAPVVAGALYDATRSYQYPMLLALCLSLLAMAAARGLAQ